MARNHFVNGGTASIHDGTRRHRSLVISVPTLKFMPGFDMKRFVLYTALGAYKTFRPPHMEQIVSTFLLTVKPLHEIHHARAFLLCHLLVPPSSSFSLLYHIMPRLDSHIHLL